VPCPVCDKLMNRVNFAHCSHVVVDVCSQHGTWFDRDELRRIVEFIRAGGLESSRAKQIEELERRQRELRSAQNAGSSGVDILSPRPSRDDWGTGLSAAAEFLKVLLR
jgi:Zn-finger nucleic acid-binding protein